MRSVEDMYLNNCDIGLYWLCCYIRCVNLYGYGCRDDIEKIKRACRAIIRDEKFVKIVEKHYLAKNFVIMLLDVFFAYILAAEDTLSTNRDTN